jgi:hypothetical protein
MSKQAGRMSQGANDFLAPYAPTIGTATNVGSGRAFNNGRADVTFTPDAINAATSFTVTSSPGAFTGTGASSPISVLGLQSGIAYTFTVTATNAAGTSPASAASNSITATTVPATLAAPTATSTVANQDDVSWGTPANGGSAITGYILKSSDGPTYNVVGNSRAVAETANTAQTYQVLATNANGNAEYSPSSTSVTTLAPFFPPFFPPTFFAPPFFPPTFFAPPFFPPTFFAPPSFFAPPFFPPSFFAPPTFFAPPSFFSPPFFPPSFFAPPSFFSPPFFPPSFFSPPTFFAPPSFFSPPRFTCIDEDTVIIRKIEDAYEFVPMKDIKVGDTIVGASWDELTSEMEQDPFTWSSESMTNAKIVETEVTNIIPSVKDITMYFNNDINKRFSLEHTVLVKREDKYMFITTGTVELGDTIVETGPDWTLVETSVLSIDTIDEERNVYQIDASPTDILIAGGIVVHNLKMF